MYRLPEMSCDHLKHNNGRSNGWMILKFYLGTPNIHVKHVSKIELDPTVQLGDMGLESGLICTGQMSENGLGPFLHSLWTWASILGLDLYLEPHSSAHLNGPRKSPLDFINFLVALGFLSESRKNLN